MLCPKLILLASSGLLAGALAASAGGAQEAIAGLPVNTNLPPALALALRPGELVGHEQVVRAYLHSGTNEFMFVMPEGMRIESAGGGRTVLVDPNMRYYLSIRLVAPPPGKVDLEGALREQVARDYAGASFPEELTVTVAERRGSGLGLRQELGGGLSPREVKILWVPFPAGTVEFILNTEAPTLPAARAAFDMILLTFRSNEHGKIEYEPRSDKT